MVAVEGIGHQHHVTLGGEAAAHVAEDGAETEDVGPDQDGGPGALAGWVEEGGVGDAGCHGDFDVFLYDLGLCVRGR